MKLERGNLWTRVTDSDREEREWLNSYLTFDDAQARFKPGVRYGTSDGKIRLFDAMLHHFPAGLTGMVLKQAPIDGLTTEVCDVRSHILPTAGANTSWLRDYQIEALEHALHEGQGILHLPTGSGKTELFAGLTISVPQIRWLFLVHRMGLVTQAAERVKLRLGIDVGVIGEGEWTEERVTCATFQSINMALKNGDPRAHALLHACEGVVTDEAHTVGAGSFWSVIMKMENAFFRIGLSGTPFARGDKRSVLVIAAIGPRIFRIRPEVLIDAGVLAKPTIKLFDIEHPDCFKPTWQGVYGELIVRNNKRNKLVLEMAKRAPKPALVFVKEVAHGKALTKFLNQSGLNAEFVWGEKDTASRDNSVRRLSHGDIDVLVCSVVFQEGVDIPDVKSVIIASGGKSVIATLQRIGRGMRVAPGKTTFEVLDINDKGNKLIQKHSKERIKAYKNEGYEVHMEGKVIV